MSTSFAFERSLWMDHPHDAANALDGKAAAAAGVRALRASAAR